MRPLGICPATLLTDPMVATDAEIRVAAEAAVAAGFGEASVWSFQLGAMSGAELHVDVVEAALAWAGTDAAAAETEAQQMSELVRVHRATKLAAVTMDPELPDPDLARRNLAALAERVAPRGATVCVEFFAWSAIDNLATAWELVEPLPDVGLILDTFHWQRQRGGPDLGLLASIPGDRITYVQLADAALEPMDDPETDAMTARLLPGEGVVDFAAFFGVLDDGGAEPFLATEIFRPAFVAEHGPARAAVAMRDAARSVLS